MDPVTVIGLVNASVDLAFKCGGAMGKMNDIASKYKHSKLTVMSIQQYLDTMQYAWEQIGLWAKSYILDASADDDAFVLRMARILETGTLVMDALEEDLAQFSDESMAFGQRVKLIWNENTFLGHQSRIRDQANSMSLLLQATQLPTPKDRGKLIRKSTKQLKKSDESAYSLVPSRMSSRLSVSTRQTDTRESILNKEEITYRPLSFENELFTARVYKRNYGNPMLVRLWNNKAKKTSDTESTSPVELVQNTSRRYPPNDGLDSIASRVRDPPPSRSVHNAHLSSGPIEQYRESLITQSNQANESTGWKDAESPYANHWAASETIATDETDNETLHPRSASLTGAPARQESSVPHGELTEGFMSVYEQGIHEKVRTLSTRGHNVHLRLAYFGFGAIHMAVMHGHIDTVRTLLQHGASVEDKTIGTLYPDPSSRTGSRPLHLAAQIAHGPMIKLLLDCGAQVSAQNDFGEQPIHVAARYGSVDVFSILVEGGAALDAADHSGHQPLHWAAKSLDQPDAIISLASMGADINAMKKLNLEVNEYERPLNMACHRGFSGNVRALLTLGADSTDRADEKSEILSGECPLHTAIDRLKYRVTNAAMVAVLESLLEHGVQDPEWLGPSGKSPLHICVENTEREPFPNLVEGMEVLMLHVLRYQADVDARDRAGNTALHYVARKRNQNPTLVARVLLGNGANIDATNNDGLTTLYLAAKLSDWELFMFMIDSGARRLLRVDGHTLWLNVESSWGVDQHFIDDKRVFELYWYPGPHQNIEEKRQLFQWLLLEAHAWLSKSKNECKILNYAHGV